MKVTTKTILKLKGQRPIVALTAYDALGAALADRVGVDLILVGDSVGTTILGFETTVPVTLDMMVHHTAAAARAHPRALLVADLPFPEAHRGRDPLLEACRRLMQEAGAEAIKLEGGAVMADNISFLVDAGIPVLGHIGLLPQRYHVLGGYRKFGKTAVEKKCLQADARALEQAGVFAIIGEMIESNLADEITSILQVPLIGIGSGPHCDGQIIVCSDIIGNTLGKSPSFVKTYANVAKTIEKAYAAYASEVRRGKYPS